MTPIRFAKMHGLGNDFVVVDARVRGALAEPGALARAVCDRRLGAGADGLLVICASDAHAARVEVWNADGSDGGMCGNGLRCVALLMHRGDGMGDAFSVEMGGRVVCVEVGRSVAVGMGAPEFELACVPVDESRIGGRDGDWVFVEGLRGMGVSMGNPHIVTVVDALPAPTDLARLGAELEPHPAFPERTNVQFVCVDAPDALRVTPWERGSGATLACASGAAAAVAACARAGLCARRAVVTMPGGALDVEWRDDGTIWCAGPAVHVYDGVWRMGWTGDNA